MKQATPAPDRRDSRTFVRHNAEAVAYLMNGEHYDAMSTGLRRDYRAVEQAIKHGQYRACLRLARYWALGGRP